MNKLTSFSIQRPKIHKSLPLGIVLFKSFVLQIFEGHWDYLLAKHSAQSHYREAARWEIFMEKELRFGLDLGRFGNF
jgi:hypothetical protein